MAAKKTTRRRSDRVLTVDIARQWCDCLDDEPFEIPSVLADYTHIDNAAAKVLGQCGGGAELNLSGIATLSPVAARALVEYSGPLVLNGIRKVDAAIVQVLASRRQNVTLLEGLEELTDRRLAKMLAISGDENGGVFLRRLRKLLPDAAKVLAKAECRLYFGGHARFSPKVNQILSRAHGEVLFSGRKRLRLENVLGLGSAGKPHDGELRFVGTSQIDADAASELARYPGSSIHFMGLKEITPEAAKEIAQFSGRLDLRDLTAVPPEAAIAIANGKAETRLQDFDSEASDGSLIVRLSDAGVFNLGDIRHLPPAVAATLSAAPVLEFRNLKKLTPAAARVLAEKHKGSLFLNGLESLPDRVAAALSGHEGSLSLRGLTHISLAAARSLISIKGTLTLGGLKKLGPRLAGVLAEFRGSLMLDGLTELTPAVARRLQKHTGILSMNGLTEISLETAKILAEKPNQKRMARCGGSVAALQYLLTKDTEQVTMLFRLNSGGFFE